MQQSKSQTPYFAFRLQVQKKIGFSVVEHLDFSDKSHFSLERATPTFGRQGELNCHFQKHRPSCLPNLKAFYWTISVYRQTKKKKKSAVQSHIGKVIRIQFKAFGKGANLGIVSGFFDSLHPSKLDCRVKIGVLRLLVIESRLISIFTLWLCFNHLVSLQFIICKLPKDENSVLRILLKKFSVFWQKDPILSWLLLKALQNPLI